MLSHIDRQLRYLAGLIADILWDIPEHPDTPELRERTIDGYIDVARRATEPENPAS